MGYAPSFAFEIEQLIQPKDDNGPLTLPFKMFRDLVFRSRMVGRHAVYAVVLSSSPVLADGKARYLSQLGGRKIDFGSIVVGAVDLQGEAEARMQNEPQGADNFLFMIQCGKMDRVLIVYIALDFIRILAVVKELGLVAIHLIPKPVCLLQQILVPVHAQEFKSGNFHRLPPSSIHMQFAHHS